MRQLLGEGSDEVLTSMFTDMYFLFGTYYAIEFIFIGVNATYSELARLEFDTLMNTVILN